jgi:hypothetical protein
MKTFPVAVLAMSLITTCAFAAAPLAATTTPKAAVAPVKPAAAPAAPVAVAPATLAAPSPLDLAKLDYIKAADTSAKHIQVVMKNAESCGMIGTQIASNMKEKNALSAQLKSKKEIDSLLTAAASGDPKKAALAKKRIDQEIGIVNDVNKMVDDNLQMIQSGLDTPTKTCQAANKSFFAIRKLSSGMLSSLNAAKKALNAPVKKASLANDGARISHEAAYDTATAQAEAARAEVQEAADRSEEPTSAVL